MKFLILLLALFSISCANIPAQENEGDDYDTSSFGFNWFANIAVMKNYRPDSAQFVKTHQIVPIQEEICTKGISIPFFTKNSVHTGLSYSTNTGSQVGGGYVQWQDVDYGGGLKELFSQIQKHHPNLKGMYDVKFDNKIFSILLYKESCVCMSAKGWI